MTEIGRASCRERGVSGQAAATSEGTDNTHHDAGYAEVSRTGGAMAAGMAPCTGRHSAAMQAGRASRPFVFHAEDGIRATSVTGVQTCALPIYLGSTGQDGGLCACRIVHVGPSSGQRLTWGPSDGLHD